MSDLTLLIIFAAFFASGHVVGHVHALVSYHKRRPMQQTGAAYTYHPSTGSFSVDREQTARRGNPQAAEPKARAPRC